MMDDLVARVKKAEADRDAWEESSANWQALYRAEHDALATLQAGIKTMVTSLLEDKWLAAYINDLYDNRKRVNHAVADRLRSLLSTSREGDSDD